MGLTWSHLFYQRAETTKIAGVGIQELKNSLKENEKMCIHLSRSFSGPQFIDSNKSCVPDYMNENLFSKRQLL